MNVARGRFVLATTAGQATAALVTVPLSMIAERLAGATESARPSLAIVMVAAGTIEGAITAGFQSLALRDARARGAFVRRSAIAFGLAWSVGMLLSYAEPSATTVLGARLLAIAVAAGSGAILGALVGTLTAPFVAAETRRRYVAASTVGWSAALVLSALLADLLGGDGAVAEVLLAGARAALVGACAASIVVRIA